METIQLNELESVTGGIGEGIMGGVRAGLLGLSLATGNPGLSPPEVKPVQIEQPANIQRPAGSAKP